MTKILVTRAENELEETSILLQNAGFESIACPLFRVVLSPLQIPPITYQAVLLTSRNGIRAISSENALNLPLIVVGEQTAESARSAGFQNILCAKGNALSLMETVLKVCHPDGGPLLYGRGEYVRHDLKKSLGQKGFSVDEKILYHLEELPQLPNTCIRSLEKKEVWGALFFSQNAARIFRKHIYREKLGKELNFIYLFGLSKIVLKAFTAGEGRALLAPSSPQIGPLIQLLGQIKDESKKRSYEGGVFKPPEF